MGVISYQMKFWYNFENEIWIDTFGFWKLRKNIIVKDKIEIWFKQICHGLTNISV